MEKIFNFEDRLVRFAGECIFFTRQLERLFENEYYKNQLIRSSGSACLNFREAQGTITNKDFIFKVSSSCKRVKRIKELIKNSQLY
ncbi:four helix bundle protein [Flavobacterium sp. EDS]|uniref:four helix bundle protein n=1 Tax=Flavobacterium sp. EDS TaxID=2897328 RepID=UPI001E2F01EA|nr:four helix bundle protein [Flavobacterium sp. EDS]MCD0473847.1 four helix bundle protein [Flavobacterium sp. EDS]